MVPKSALGGYKHALFQLAYCCEFGIGTNENVEQAKNWYLKFAEEDEPVGLHRLGGIYARGVDGKTDQVQAYRWFYLSYIMTGNERYLENLKDSMVMMTAQEQEKALSLAEDWIEGRYRVQTQGLRRDIEKLILAIDDFELFLCKGLDFLTPQLVLTGLRLVKQREFELANALFMHHSKEPLGQFLLGYVCMQQTCDVNLAKAFEWFLKSAKAGCSLAFFFVGLCYSEGLPEQPYGWISPAIDQNPRRES